MNTSETYDNIELAELPAKCDELKR